MTMEPFPDGALRRHRKMILTVPYREREQFTVIMYCKNTSMCTNGRMLEWVVENENFYEAEGSSYFEFPSLL